MSTFTFIISSGYHLHFYLLTYQPDLTWSPCRNRGSKARDSLEATRWSGWRFAICQRPITDTNLPVGFCSYLRYSLRHSKGHQASSKDIETSDISLNWLIKGKKLNKMWEEKLFWVCSRQLSTITIEPPCWSEPELEKEKETEIRWRVQVGKIIPQPKGAISPVMD